MPSLTVELGQRRQTGGLGERVTIGRRTNNGIVVPGGDVAPLHAWIGNRHGHYYVVDATGRGQTLLNDRPVHRWHKLHDGDRIGVGSAKITFHLSEGAKSAFDSGILFQCVCGRPVWAPRTLTGKPAKCPHCYQWIAVAQRDGEVGRVVRHRRDAEPAATCSICQWPVQAHEPRHKCPSCGLVFHADCWTENFGCSAYGCPQVNILRVQEDAVADETCSAESSDNGDLADAEFIVTARSVPWEHIVLAITVVAALAGAPAFGTPALLAGIGSILYIRHQKRVVYPRIVLAAWILSAIGTVGGAAASYMLYFT